MTRTRRLLLACLAGLPWPASAEREGRGGPWPPGQAGGRGAGGGAPRAGLGTVELTIARSWLTANPGWSAQPLPPGMRRRLAMGKPLPPGIARRAVPGGLLEKLPVRPGYEYAVIGATLVLLEAATGAVAGLLTDVLLPR